MSDFQFFADRVKKSEVTFREEYCERNAGETTASAYIEKCSVWFEIQDVCYCERVEDVVLVEVVNVLSRDNVNFGVPVGVEFKEFSELNFLRLSEFRPIFEYLFHICCWCIFGCKGTNFFLEYGFSWQKYFWSLL